MHPIAYLVAALSLTALIFSAIQKSSEEIITSGELEAVSGNMLVYRNAVARYALNNPSATGAITDTALDLPDWYRKNSLLGNYVSSGQSYVFYSGGDIPGLAGALHAKTESVSVGINTSGILNTPARGNTGFSLPSQVPNHAVVILQ